MNIVDMSVDLAVGPVRTTYPDMTNIAGYVRSLTVYLEI